MTGRYERLVRAVARSRWANWPLTRIATAIDKRLLRWSNGRIALGIGSQIGRQTLLLHCIGARTGVERAVPLLFAVDGECLVLIASRAGTDQHPYWYFNLLATPRCRVTGANIVDSDLSHYLAAEVQGAERDRLWQLAVDLNPGYESYAQRTRRRIPVLRLRPIPR